MACLESLPLYVKTCIETSIGLSGITENLQEYLKNMSHLIMQQQRPASDDKSGSSESLLTILPVNLFF